MRYSTIEVSVNMGNRKIEYLRKIYKAGDRLRCIHMEDANGVPPGTTGTVQYVDDAGNVHMKWDNGSCLSYLPDIDRVQKLNNR